MVGQGFFPYSTIVVLSVYDKPPLTILIAVALAVFASI